MVNYDKKAKKIISDAMSRFAKEQGVSMNETQILISYAPQGVPTYKVMVNYTPKADKTVDDIYQIKFDIVGVKGIISMFIAKALERIATDSNNTVNDINVIIYQLNEERGVELFAYNKTQKIAPLTWAYVFGEEAMLKMVENESNIN